MSNRAGEPKTEAIRVALAARRDRLRRAGHEGSEARLRRFLEDEVWPTVPPTELGHRLSRHEEDRILGYGRDGV